jgi:hypothetical protein
MFLEKRSFYKYKIIVFVNIVAIYLCHFAYAGTVNNCPVKMMSLKNTWKNFEWNNVYKSKLYTSVNWEMKYDKEDFVERATYTDIDGVKGRVIFRGRNESNLDVILLSFEKLSKIDTSKLLSWCVENYGSGYVESRKIFQTTDIHQEEIYHCQWIIGNTVITFVNFGILKSTDIIFRDVSKSDILKPDIKLECKYIVTLDDNSNKLHAYYVIEDKENGLVKNENMVVLPYIKSQLSNSSIKLIFDNDTRHQELLINRMTGEILGSATVKDHPDWIIKIEGECSKYEKLNPKF